MPCGQAPPRSALVSATAPTCIAVATAADGHAVPPLSQAGRLPMNVHGVRAFVLAQAVWGLAVAVLLIRNRL
jgi:hypothetical protein